MKLRNALTSKFFALVAFIVGASQALAAPTFSSPHTILSSFKDSSNLAVSQSLYDIDFSQDSGDPDLFINQISLNLGSGWDSNLDLGVNSSFNSYTLGSLITGASSFRLDNAILRSGDVNAAVATGIYDFSVDIVGGASNSATDVLSTLNFQLEVFDRLEFEISSLASPSTIQQGDSSTVSVTLGNAMSARDLVTTTWYYAGGGYEQGSDSLTGNFVGDWFNKTITPGNSRTDDHTTWTAAAIQPTGTYDGNFGIFGGLYNGDEHWLRAPNSPITVTPVPEPATMAVLGLGALGLLKRRRKS
jgi:hypothetical protein